jgi:hypothetical protein
MCPRHRRAVIVIAYGTSTNTNGNLTWLPDPASQARLADAPPEVAKTLEETVEKLLDNMAAILSAAIGKRNADPLIHLCESVEKIAEQVADQD